MERHSPELAEVEEALEQATPEELQHAREVAYEEFLSAARIARDQGELRMELKERLETQHESDRQAGVQQVVTEIFIAEKIRELEEIQEPPEISQHAITERIRRESEQTLAA